MRSSIIFCFNSALLPHAGKWALTAGHIKAGETPIQALRLELKAELCIDLADSSFFPQGLRREDGDGNPPIRHFVNHYIVSLPKDITPATGKDVATVDFVPVNKVLEQPER